MDWKTFISTVVVAAIAGGAASILTPWAQHATATRHARDERRIEQIRLWRDMVARHHALPRPVPTGVGNDPEFFSLRPFLGEQVIKMVETHPLGNEVTITLGLTGLADTPDLLAVSKAIDGLERQWGLI